MYLALSTKLLQGTVTSGCSALISLMHLPPGRGHEQIFQVLVGLPRQHLCFGTSPNEHANCGLLWQHQLHAKLLVYFRQD